MFLMREIKILTKFLKIKTGCLKKKSIKLNKLKKIKILKNFIYHSRLGSKIQAQELVKKIQVNYF